MIPRREFIKRSLAVSGAVAVSRRGRAAESSRRPNILFIAIDDQNDWLGCMGGHPQVRTPHIDALARRGTLFLNGHCQAPLCNPSRVSLLTGLRPSTTGVYALNPWFRTVDALKNLVTLPQCLASHGYRTLATGKVIHDGYPPRDQRAGEFDVWGFDGGFGPRPKQKMRADMGSHPLIDWGIYPERDEDQDDWKVASWAIEQLRNPPAQPFFLGVGIRHPHVPCFATKKWFDLYPEESLVLPKVKEDDLDDLPRFAAYLHWNLPEPTLELLRQHDQWRSLVRAYLASVSFADSQVGRVLDALRQANLADNTIVVLWGDNGWHLGEKAMTGKTTLWDRSTRVPLIFAGPGISPGGRCTQPAELLDMYPTLLDLCGLPARPGLEGHSLVSQLRQADAPRQWPAITTHGPNNHGIRSQRWRYIRYADGSEELYDMQADPNEWTNLTAEARYAQVKREHTRFLPKVSAEPVLGSSSRLIDMRDGAPYWEGKPIEDDRK